MTRLSSLSLSLFLFLSAAVSLDYRRAAIPLERSLLFDRKSPVDSRWCDLFRAPDASPGDRRLGAAAARILGEGHRFVFRT